ncbi:peptidyl-prolyl cis-trans isomerase SurA [Natronospira proteinivora]|uniref:Chaperone SurA n=1 Tax=Natronospira proteinivora TaxID=1807133 RepID=A0ABT1G906_9GAMM|nr:peptidylprolyl isomerase [Natronospira proteinivora]MCP1727390.1 peptidyl-prolyl cis-trans isomerase SurA [Natronospira proteinivora]
MKHQIIIGTALLLALAVTSLAANTPLDRIVAVVDDEVILDSELQERIESLRVRMGDQGTQLPPEQDLRQQMLEQMINEEVQLQRARRAGLRVSDDEVNQALARIASQNDVTLAQLPDMLASEGIEYGSFREEIRRELIQQQVQQRMLFREVTVSEREVQEFLAEAEAQGDLDAEYQVFHIMIAADSEGDAEETRQARERAQDIRRQLDDGADFAELAIAHSDSRTALEGGDMGWRSGPELPSVFAEQVVDMGEGDIAGPLRTSSGYHLIKLNEARRGDAVMVPERRARHILLSPSEVRLPEAARLKLVELRQRIEDGEDFADLAREYSEDPGSSARGGNLGWQSRGSFAPTFEQALDGLQPGEISEPIETRFGWHIVELMETREQDRTLDARRNQAQQMIRARKAEERMDTWLQQLRDESYIEIRLDG